MMMKIKKQSGLTLIEMMIAMLLGLLVTGSIIAIFISNVKSSSENIKMIHLNQELRTVMGFMSDELKRSGYSADPGVNFFGGLVPVNPTCLLYSYDADGSGTIDASGAENYGFRIDSGRVMWGNSADNTCDFGEAITDINTAEIIVIDENLPNCPIADFPVTDITLSVIPAGTVNVQQIVVRLTAKTSLAGDEVCRTITETIRVRNEDAS